jgi:hypothetical protein
MKRPVVLIVVVVVLLAVVASVGFYLFEKHERGGIKAEAAKPCGTLADPSPGAPAELPLGLPLSAGSKVLRVAEQGKTTVAFAATQGTRDDVVTVRDRVLSDLAGAGYRATGTDQEPGFEAEAELAGTHDGTLRVKPLCTGVLEVRYTIER